MKIQDMTELPPASRAQVVRHLVVYGIILGILFAAAMIGSDKSERAHRALDMQYQHCEDRYGFGGEGFSTCLGR